MTPEFLLDGYKCDHRSQYHPSTQEIYSNFTPRGNKYAPYADKVVFVGLQAFIIETLINDWNKNFFKKKKTRVLARYKKVMDGYLGKDTVDVSHIGALHDLGYLPLRIKALPEGAKVNLLVPLVTVTNTHPDFFWLTNYVETILSAELWKVCTNATLLHAFYTLLKKYAHKTCDNSLHVPYQVHDFSMRGMSGGRDAAHAGMGHLALFKGTDCIPAILRVSQYYREKNIAKIANSIPATEHSVATSNILYLSQTQGYSLADAEVEVFKNLITKVYPSGYVSLVSDSFDYWEMIANGSRKLKDTILAREGCVIFRPDGGDPIDVLAGHIIRHIPADIQSWDQIRTYLHQECDYDEPRYAKTEDDRYFRYGYEDTTYIFEEVTSSNEIAEIKGTVETLYEIYGGTINKKGYKVLNPKVGTIFGDSITLERARAICERLEAKGFASSNFALGIGSYSLNCNSRDFFQFAMKATSTVIDGKRYEIYKDPKTDKSKKSARGLLRVEKEGNDYVLYDQQTEEQETQGELQIVFENSKLMKKWTFNQVRKRARSVR